MQATEAHAHPPTPTRSSSMMTASCSRSSSFREFAGHAACTGHLHLNGQPLTGHVPCLTENMPCLTENMPCGWTGAPISHAFIHNYHSTSNNSCPIYDAICPSTRRKMKRTNRSVCSLAPREWEGLGGHTGSRVIHLSCVPFVLRQSQHALCTGRLQH